MDNRDISQVKPFDPSCRRTVEIRSFKWPHRFTGTATARLLGEDEFGRWLGVAKGDPWWDATGMIGGVVVASFVKLVPTDTYWTAGFNLVDPLVDVDVALPVQWLGDTLEEVDLELDVHRFTDGSVRVRDQEEFDRVRKAWAMPDEVVRRAEATCGQLRELVAAGAEPFGDVGPAWLSHFLGEVGAPGC
jgi:uncharacterized protein